MTSPPTECLFERDTPHRFVCVKCRRVVRTKRIWRADQVHCECKVQRNGLGDCLALALARVGITKDRVDRALSTIDRWRGKPPQEQQAGCGCTVRQQALNRFGWKWQHRANKLGWYFRHRLTWLRTQFCRVRSTKDQPPQ